MRTLLTALVSKADVLRGRSADMSATNRDLLDIVANQLQPFWPLLQDLIGPARLGAGSTGGAAGRPVDLLKVVGHSLAETRTVR